MLFAGGDDYDGKGKPITGFKLSTLQNTSYLWPNCDGGNTQLNNKFNENNVLSPSIQMETGVFEVQKFEDTPTELVYGCECKTLRPFLIKTETEFRGPITVYFEVDFEV